jgi:hypothetical protein
MAKANYSQTTLAPSVLQNTETPIESAIRNNAATNAATTTMLTSKAFATEAAIAKISTSALCFIADTSFL